jgi:hypothetical protein
MVTAVVGVAGAMLARRRVIAETTRTTSLT